MWRTSKGLLQERVTDPNTGLEKIVSVKIKGSGLKAEQEASRKLNEKIEHISDNRIKLSEAIDLFLKECEKTRKASTTRKYGFSLHSFYEIVGESYLDRLTAGFIRQKLTESGKENKTLNEYLKQFKVFWLWAYRCDYVKSREVTDKLVKFQDIPMKEKIQDKYLEPWELNKLLDNMKEERWKLLSRFLVLSGMRIGEVIALNRCDLWGTIIRITKTYDVNNNIITSPKSFDSKREIYIQDELKECIADIDRYFEKMKEIFDFESDLFFPNHDGGYLQYPSYSKYLRELSERTLNRRCSPHIFRHTHCSLLASAGYPLDAISRRLGHADSKITKEIYLHITAEMKEKENSQLNKIHLIG